MSQPLDSYLVIVLTMALLSLWKTYIGPAIAGVLSYSYPEMLVFNLLPALISAYVGWRVVPFLRLLFGSKKPSPFNPKLRVFKRRWNRYGQSAMAVLAPVLVGVPTYTALSKRLNQTQSKTFGLLMLSLLFWSSAAYFSFLLLDIEQYVSFEHLFPASVLEALAE